MFNVSKWILKELLITFQQYASLWNFLCQLWYLVHDGFCRIFSWMLVSQREGHSKAKISYDASPVFPHQHILATEVTMGHPRFMQAWHHGKKPSFNKVVILTTYDLIKPWTGQLEWTKEDWIHTSHHCLFKHGLLNHEKKLHGKESLVKIHNA